MVVKKSKPSDRIQASMVTRPVMNLFQQAVDAIAVYDAAGRYCSANEAVVKLFGIPAQTCLGKTNLELSQLGQCAALQPTLAQIHHHLEQVVQTGQPLRSCHNLPIGQTQIGYDVTYSPLLDANGHVQQILSIGRVIAGSGLGSCCTDPLATARLIDTIDDMIDDMTERKQAEDLLRQSSARYQNLAQREQIINNVAAQIRSSLDLNTILQTVVQQVRQLLDTDRVVIYQFRADWQGIVVTEDVIEPWRSVLGDIGADDCFPEKYAALYASGRVRAISNLNDPGLDQCHVNFLRSLQVQANLIVPIQVQDHLWGLLIAHECRGERDWIQEELTLLEALAGQIGVAIRQSELYAQAQINAEQARSQAQQLQLTLTELQQMQIQLIQTEKMSSLGQLVAGVAHEINNPVNFIYGNLGYIQNYTQDLINLFKLYQQYYPDPVPAIRDKIEAIDLDFLIEDFNKILHSVHVGADRIREIVLSLRSFSRLDESDMKIVDLHEGIDSTLLILHHRLKLRSGETGVNLIKNYGQLPKVECYPSQLNQVFMNILANALDALEQHQENCAAAQTAFQPQITIRTERLLESPFVRISIRDNGTGIPQALQKQLFDPFFTTKPVGKGTGLGLSISHQIVVRKHHGQIRCYSSPATGTEFQIEIPIKQKRPASVTLTI